MLDVIGIGVGPFNLSLAALLHGQSIRARFFEQRARFQWHPGMLLPGTTLQVPFLADLVSLADPTSPFSFLKYLQTQGRLFRFYFLENSHIPRREYNHYCQWVCAQLATLDFSCTVRTVRAEAQGFSVEVQRGPQLETYRCRNVVLGMGTTPQLPAPLVDLAERFPERCLHTAHFKDQFSAAPRGRVLLLGSGQSAAEIFLAMLARQGEDPAFALDWVTRSEGFFPMEYSPLGLEHFSPDYTAYFQALSGQQRQALLSEQDLLYKGISFQTLRDIYEQLYHASCAGSQPPVSLRARCELIEAHEIKGRFLCRFRERIQQREFECLVDYILAATGYCHSGPQKLGLENILERDQAGRLCIDADFRVSHQGEGGLFAQNLDLISHGVGTPDLGLGAIRAAHIANQLLSRQVYRLPAQPVFQQFGVTA